MKESVAEGWNHEYHQERLQKYKDRYFKDVQELVGVLNADHLAVFYDNLAPISDDLEYQIQQYEKLTFPAGKDK